MANSVYINKPKLIGWLFVPHGITDIVIITFVNEAHCYLIVNLFL